MDIEFSPEQQDIMGDVGFSNMLFQVLNLKPGAALWAAPVCSTWVYMILSRFKVSSFLKRNFFFGGKT